MRRTHEKRIHRCRLELAVIILAVTVSVAEAQHRYPIENPKEDTIKLGMSTALTGPAAILGQNMKLGVEAAIAEFNLSGGIQGRSLQLIALDDGYEPSRAAPNMRRLIDRDRVLAVIGNVGTPTAVAAIPIANAGRTPFFGAVTGAGILRKNPPDRYVINYRASYLEEVTAMVDALITFGKLKPQEIAFFTQRDAYGDAGFASGIWAMRLYGLKDENGIIHSRYERNTLAVENGLAEMLLASPPPRAVSMVGTYAPCAAFISLAKKSGFQSVFLNVSFVGGESLAEKLGEDGDGVIITQVVPPFGSDLPVIREHEKALEVIKSPLPPSSGSLEGYIAMRILGRSLGSLNVPVTREAIVDALENLGDFDIGLGQPLRLSSKEHQACHVVWPTVIQSGRIVPFQWQQLAIRLERGAHD